VDIYQRIRSVERLVSAMTVPPDLDARPGRPSLAGQPRYLLLLAGGLGLIGLAGAAVVVAGGEFGAGGPDRLVGAATLCAATGCGLLAGGVVLAGVRLAAALGSRTN
jgi:hypothetical protein